MPRQQSRIRLCLTKQEAHRLDYRPSEHSRSHRITNTVSPEHKSALLNYIHPRLPIARARKAATSTEDPLHNPLGIGWPATSPLGDHPPEMPRMELFFY